MALSASIRSAVYERDKGICRECGEPVREFGNVVSPFSPACAAVGRDRVLRCLSCHNARSARKWH